MEATGLRTDAAAAAYAQMLCTLAYTAARGGQRTEALAMTEEAGRAASRLPSTAPGVACSPSLRLLSTCMPWEFTGRWAMREQRWRPARICGPPSSPRPSGEPAWVRTWRGPGGRGSGPSRRPRRCCPRIARARERCGTGPPSAASLTSWPSGTRVPPASGSWTPAYASRRADTHAQALPQEGTPLTHRSWGTPHSRPSRWGKDRAVRPPARWPHEVAIERGQSLYGSGRLVGGPGPRILCDPIYDRPWGMVSRHFVLLTTAPSGLVS